MRPLLLDLFCCQGGASRGYVDAGFDVVGVDIEPQPRYPYPMVVGDALAVLDWLLNGSATTWDYDLMSRAEGLRITGTAVETECGKTFSLSDFDAIHASPPCQARTKAQKIQKNQHPNLIAPTRELILRTGLPYVIENVVPEDEETDSDPLIDPAMLCGAMFGIETYRHRLFETNWGLTVPAHPEHVARTTKMGRAPVDGEFMHIVGNFSGVDRARRIMRMPWANRDGLREAIPPAYAEYVGTRLLRQIEEVAA